MKISNIFLFVFLFAFLPGTAFSQLDSIKSRINYELDFRFRIEQDWNSRKADGSFRDNRSRLRYRLRTGFNYSHKWYTFGSRIRTGDQRKQQDPQLTIGDGFEEFGTLPIGFEKVYFQGDYEGLKFWLGKNDFSFRKNNELFWSDNVYPGGVFLRKKFDLKSSMLSDISFAASHYILSASGLAFSDDAYVQGFQSELNIANERFAIFPSFYRMKNIPIIPDGASTFDIDYNILHIGAQWKILPKQGFTFELDLYQNFENYDGATEINENLINQKQGLVLGLQKGGIKKKNDYLVKITYAYLERFAVLDYMAQNDWARWDYSNFDSPDGRLTNFQGVEIVGAYALSDKAKLVAKFYLVDQLIALGPTSETGSRFRIDFDIKL